LKTPEKEVESALAHLLKLQYRIHFHTWTAITLQEFFKNCQTDIGFPVSICEFKKNGIELIAVLKKEPA